MQIDDKIYILNPQYRLKVDKSRVLLYYKNADPPIEKGISNFLGFLHPVFAVLLCLFDGKKSLKKVLDEFVYITDLKRESVSKLISQLVENKTEIKIDSNNHSFYFPKNTLIQQGTKNEVIHYNPYDFLIPNNQLDFQTHRLYEPLDTMIILNNICVTQCIYCYSDKRELFPCKIPFERLVEIIQEAQKIGMRAFNISGGELFTYRHWKEFLKELVENNFDPYITTKYPLNERRIKELKDIGIKRIQLSIDTIKSDEMHQLLNVNEKYHVLILKTLKDLDNNNFDIRINSQITSINQDSMEAFFNYLLNFENINRIRVRATGFSLYSKGVNYPSLRPAKNKLNKIKDLVIKLREKHQDRVILDFFEYPERRYYINPSAEEKRIHYENRAQCSGNFYSFDILPDGKVTICEELYWHPQFIIGDLMKQSITDIWNSEKALSLYHFSKDSVRDKSPCKTCNHKDFNRCHQQKGACWKQILYAYGEENWDYPDPRCQHAPEPFNEFWIE